MSEIVVSWCDSCDEYKNDPEDIEHCKSLRHSIYSGVGKIKNEIKTNFKKLGKNSCTTIQQKQQAQKTINELQETAGYTKTDWDNPEESDYSLIKKLYQFFKGNISGLVVSADDSSQVYAKVKTGNHIEIISLDSVGVIQWLMYHHKNNTDEFYSADTYKNTIQHIISDSQFNGITPREPIHNRICQKKDRIYYDLGRTDWEFVRITAQNYIILPYAESFPVFERIGGMVQQVLPDELSKMENILEDLCNLFRIQDKILFKVHLIHMFFQNQETPFMFFDGIHGSSKTITTQMIKCIVDPSSANIGSFSIEKKDLQSNISNKYLIAYDNVSGFDHSISDMLCRALSGDEISKRKHYTNNDLFTKSYSKKKFVFNGISPSIEFPDFNDRTTYYKTIRIAENKKLSKSEVWERFHELLPHVLHQIFSILSKTFANHNIIGARITPKTRLADFEMYGETISQMLGYKPNEFLNLYYIKREEITLKDNDSYPIIRVIDYFMESRQQKDFEGLTSQLHCDLSSNAINLSVDTKEKYSNWPKKSNHLVQQINKLQEQFRKVGYEISTRTYTKREPKPWHNRSITKIIPIDQSLVLDPDHADHPDQTQNHAYNSENLGRDGKVQSDEPNHYSDQKMSHFSSESNTDRNNCTSTGDIHYTNWICPVCHQDNLELIKINNADGDGKTEQYHQDAGHTISYFTKKQTDEYVMGYV